jgi:hypothetical protein
MPACVSSLLLFGAVAFAAPVKRGLKGVASYTTYNLPSSYSAYDLPPTYASYGSYAPSDNQYGSYAYVPDTF